MEPVSMDNCDENLDPIDSALTSPGDDQAARTQMDDVEMDGLNRTWTENSENA